MLTRDERKRGGSSWTHRTPGVLAERQGHEVLQIPISIWYRVLSTRTARSIRYDGIKCLWAKVKDDLVMSSCHVLRIPGMCLHSHEVTTMMAGGLNSRHSTHNKAQMTRAMMCVFVCSYRGSY